MFDDGGVGVYLMMGKRRFEGVKEEAAMCYGNGE